MRRERGRRGGRRVPGGGSSDPNALYGLMLRFTNTSGGCRDITLLRPRYPRGTTQLFHTAFLQRLAPLQCVRVMQLQSTQETTVVEWSQRVLPTHATQSRVYETPRSRMVY